MPVYNHFENISVLSTKTGLLKTLKEYYILNKQAQECNYSVEDTLPLAYCITPNFSDPEFIQFKKKYTNIERSILNQAQLKSKLPEKQYTNNIWLLKPAN